MSQLVPLSQLVPQLTSGPEQAASATPHDISCILQPKERWRNIRHRTGGLGPLPEVLLGAVVAQGAVPPLLLLASPPVAANRTVSARKTVPFDLCLKVGTELVKPPKPLPLPCSRLASRQLAAAATGTGCARACGGKTVCHTTRGHCGTSIYTVLSNVDCCYPIIVPGTSSAARCGRLRRQPPPPRCACALPACRRVQLHLH